MPPTCTKCGADAPQGAKLCVICGGTISTTMAGPSPPALDEPLAPTSDTPALDEPAPHAPEPERDTPESDSATKQAAERPDATAIDPVGPTEIAAPAPGWSFEAAATNEQPTAFSPPKHRPTPAGPPVGYGAPVAAPVGPGPYAAAPPRRDNTFMKLGCGIAGCVGIGVVLVMTMAVVIFLVAASAAPSPAGRSAAPGSGSIRELVRDEVGPFRLLATNDTPADGEFRDGAIDSLALQYHSPSGVEIKHIVVAYDTEERAESMPARTLETLRANRGAGEPPLEHETEPYQNKDGQVIGELMHIKSDPEYVLWANGKLFCFVKGPPGEAARFARTVPY